MDRSLEITALIVGLVLVSSITPVAAHDGDSTIEDQIVIDVQSESEAVVTESSSYDLTNGSEQERFASIQEGQTEQLKEQFRTELESTIAGSDRSITIDSVSVTTMKSDDVGSARVSAQISGQIVSVDDGGHQFSLSSTGLLDSHKELTILFPETTDTMEVSPDASASDSRSVVWNHGVSGDTIEISYTVTSDQTTEEQTTSRLPGVSPAETSDSTGPFDSMLFIGLSVGAIIVVVVGLFWVNRV